MIINNKEVVSLGDLYDVLKTISEYDSEILYDMPIMMSIRENDEVKDYYVEQIDTIAKGTSMPHFFMRNYSIMLMRESAFVPIQSHEEIIKSIKGDNKRIKL